MEKTGQKRGLLNKLREKINFPGESMENLFNPDSEFGKIMDKLRDEVDDPIRSILLGEDVSNKTKYPEGMSSGDISAKDLLKEANTSFNRREYMTCVYHLDRFHEKMLDIRKLLNNFKYNIDEVHKQFLFKDLDENVKKHLQEKMKARYASENFEIIKNAGIVDFWKNITTERGQALAAWEKKYPGKVKKLKSDTKNLLSKSQGLLDFILSLLKKMASARATRNVDNYINDGLKITQKVDEYNKLFKKYYEENVKDFLNNPMMNPVESVGQSSDNIGPVIHVAPSPVGQPAAAVQPAPAKPHASVEPVPPTFRSNQLQNVQVVSPPQSSSKAPTIRDDHPPTIRDDHPPTVRDDESPHAKRFTHAIFQETLEALANEHPLIIKSFIVKYASSIERTDPNTSKELIKIADSISEE